MLYFYTDWDMSQISVRKGGGGTLEICIMHEWLNHGVYLYSHIYPYLCICNKYFYKMHKNINFFLKAFVNQV